MKGLTMSNDNVIIEGATEETAEAPRQPRFKTLLKKINDNAPIIAIATASLVTVGGIILLNRWEKNELSKSSTDSEVIVIDVTPED